MIGNVKNMNCLLVDDMIDTAGSIINAAGLLKKNGSKDIYVAATHGLLSNQAIPNLEKSDIKKILITDTIDRNSYKLPNKFEIVSIAKILAEAIKRNLSGDSLSELFFD